jgi:hypothetical protein
MAGGAAHLQIARAEGHPVPVGKGNGHVLGADGRRQSDGATGGRVQAPAAGDMVGMGMGVEAGHQADAELLNQREITGVLLIDRIDQHPLAGGPIGEQVGEGARVGVEQLAEKQGASPRRGGQGEGETGRELNGHTPQSIIMISA